MTTHRNTCGTYHTNRLTDANTQTRSIAEWSDLHRCLASAYPVALDDPLSDASLLWDAIGSVCDMYVYEENRTLPVTITFPNHAVEMIAVALNPTQED